MRHISIYESAMSVKRGESCVVASGRFMATRELRQVKQVTALFPPPHPPTPHPPRHTHPHSHSHTHTHVCVYSLMLTHKEINLESSFFKLLRICPLGIKEAALDHHIST